jgi:hypothetical protein
MEQNTQNKYDVFFEGMINFIQKTGLSDEYENIGANYSEISSFENEYKIKFPLVFKSYLKYFGKKTHIRMTDSVFEMTIPNIAKTIDESNKNRVIEIIDKKNFKVNYDDNYPEENEGEYTPPIKDLIDISNITIFYWDQLRSEFNFFDSSKENPEVFFFVEYSHIISKFYTFTTDVRGILFLAISLNANTEFQNIYCKARRDNGRPSPPPVDCSGIEWLKDYIYLAKNFPKKFAEIDHFREEYYAINSEMEKRENRILTIDEFEYSFLNYLRENGYEF